MTHTISHDAIEQLASLKGVTDFQEWQNQLMGADERIAVQLHGSVQNAWDACFPSWLALGRVCDMSRAVRAPRYWPSYATKLGYEFARIFYRDYQFVIDVLERMPSDSHEYLCALDLLVMMLPEFRYHDRTMPACLFRLDNELPAVVRYEICHDEQYRDVVTVGEFLERDYLINWGDESE